MQSWKEANALSSSCREREDEAGDGDDAEEEGDGGGARTTA